MVISIIGAGALGKIIADIYTCSLGDINGFYDDNIPRGEMVMGLPILGSVSDLVDLEDKPAVIIGVGDVTERKKIFEGLISKQFKIEKAIHPSVRIHPVSKIKIGDGCIIKEGAVIEHGVSIGANSIIGNNATICHDSIIGKNCRIAPGVTIAGHVIIGDDTYLAVNVSVDRKIKIGKNVTIASGCTIWKDIPDNSIVKLPAKMLVEEKQ